MFQLIGIRKSTRDSGSLKLRRLCVLFRCASARRAKSSHVEEGERARHCELERTARQDAAECERAQARWRIALRLESQREEVRSEEADRLGGRTSLRQGQGVAGHYATQKIRQRPRARTSSDEGSSVTDRCRPCDFIDRSV